MDTIDAEAAAMPFIRNLASSDRKLRTHSLDTLKTYLSSRQSSLSPPEALKLWTGLFYALWMTDRAPAQQALATELAGLLSTLRDDDDAACFLVGFWTVLSRKWTTIDALRMDKFLLLVRRVFAAHLRFALTDEQGRRTSLVLNLLHTHCFDVDDEHAVAVGLRLHVLDIWVDEMQREGALDEGNETGRLLVDRVGELVERLGRACVVKSIRGRAAESYRDERLPWASETAEAATTTKRDDRTGQDRQNKEDDGDSWEGFDD